MGSRQPVRITVTVEGELDPTTVKAEAFSFALATVPDDGEGREMTERAASHLAGSLRASAQVLVMAADVGSLLEAVLPSFEARRDGGFRVVVDAPGLGPEDGGAEFVDRGD
ncbi:hypothetical protein ACI8AF_21780 [Blastococcus sp. SYSU D00669]